MEKQSIKELAPSESVLLNTDLKEAVNRLGERLKVQVTVGKKSEVKRIQAL